jgi:LacI family transcriptional regulator
VPATLSIAGYDNIPCAAFLEVPLTTVGYSAQAIGRLAAERVVALMQADGHLPTASATLLEPNLIERASCAPPLGSAETGEGPPGRTAGRTRARKLRLGA